MIEQSLASFQSQVESTLDRANVVAKRLKRLKAAAQTGDLREIEKSLQDLKELATALQDQTAGLAFDFDETGYFPEKYLDELAEAARAEGLTVFVQDGKLYCYPLLLRVRTAERTVQINKTNDRGIRPSALAAKLRKLQAKPAKFPSGAFLNLLRRAWTHCASQGESPVVTLAEIYEMLTLMPGAAKEYTRDDFARDLYLLDRSGVTKTDKGVEFRFHAATGTRNAAHTFVCIAEDGSEKRYYGIAFIASDEAAA
jgi:hypothetical protein